MTYTFDIMRRIELQSPTANRSCAVLVAEDNMADAFVIQAALQEWFEADPPAFHLEVTIVPNGGEALDYLAGSEGASNAYQDAPEADLIILNLNMPVMNGMEALMRIKQHPQWRCIPTVMYSASDSSTTVTDSLKAYANAYLQKAVNFDQTVMTLRQTMEFFLGTVLPYRVPNRRLS
ncbi:MAG: response regulator [Bacteroidota bacterium]